MSKRIYRSQRRNGYWGVDEYLDNQCLRTVTTGTANGPEIARLMMQAYQQGRIDESDELARLLKEVAV